MAPGTIHANGLVMHVGVTAETVRFSLGENKGRMTLLAIDLIMLSFQGKLGGTVIKRIDLPVQFPSLWTVANIAT